MRAPMYTFASVRRARRYVGSSRSSRRDKVILRRVARRRDKLAVARGEYDLVHRGQDAWDIA